MTGFNRAFQASDGACVCISGYIYYDEVDQIQSEGNDWIVLINLSCKHATKIC